MKIATCPKCDKIVIRDWAWNQGGKFYREPFPSERIWIEAATSEAFRAFHGYSRGGKPGRLHLCDPVPAVPYEGIPLHRRPVGLENLITCLGCGHSTVVWPDLPTPFDPGWWQRRALWSLMSCAERRDTPFALCLSSGHAIAHECPPEADCPLATEVGFRESFGPRWRHRDP
jgi:hypothetical protein